MANKFKILTWNIWFDPIMMTKRMKEIAKRIKAFNPHVFLLQEVTFENLKVLLEQLEMLGLAYYRCSANIDHYLIQNSAYFNLIFSRLPYKQRDIQIPFVNSKQGRELTLATVQFQGFELNVATFHLESPVRGISGSKERKKQIEMTFEVVKGSQIAIIGGDTNWNNISLQEFGEINLPSGWKDAWIALKPREKGFTYDGLKNEMIRNNFRARIDRLIFTSEATSPTRIELIGTETIKNVFQGSAKNGRKVLPSDHYGVYCEFEIFPK